MPSPRFVEAASPEQHLLLLTARTHADATLDAEAKALIGNSTIDWKAFFNLATLHGVLGLCYAVVRRVHYAALPEQDHQHLQRVVMATAMHNLEMTQELTRIDEVLKADDIPAMTYKGPTLASLAYGGVGQRQFSDLDVLVPADRLVQAETLLIDLGYFAISDPEHRPVQKFDPNRSYQGYDLVRADGRVTVDLQMRFGLRYSSFDLAFDTLWAGRQTVNFGQKGVFTLSFEDYLLVLAAHGTQHRWNRLKWVCDIAQIARATPDVDWGRVLARAKAMQVQRMVFVALLLAHEALGLPLPAHVLAAAQADSTAKALTLRVFKWMFIETVGFVMLTQRAWFDYGFDLALRPRFSDKVRIVLFLTRRRLFSRHQND